MRQTALALRLAVALTHNNARRKGPTSIFMGPTPEGFPHPMNCFSRLGALLALTPRPLYGAASEAEFASPGAGSQATAVPDDDAGPGARTAHGR